MNENSFANSDDISARRDTATTVRIFFSSHVRDVSTLDFARAPEIINHNELCGLLACKLRQNDNCL